MDTNFPKGEPTDNQPVNEGITQPPNQVEPTDGQSVPTQLEVPTDPPANPKVTGPEKVLVETNTVPTSAENQPISDQPAQANHTELDVDPRQIVGPNQIEKASALQERFNQQSQV